MIPNVNIKYGKLIDPFFKEFVSVNYEGYKFPTYQEVEEKISLFKKTWAEKGPEFISFLYRTTGLEFKRNTIDCFIVSATPRDMSAPLIIRSRYSEEEFLDSIRHELIHVFLSDNKLKKIEGFNNESKTTINHIKVFALLEKYYKEVLKDEDNLIRLKNKSDEKNPDYLRAWEIVEEKGYQNIVSIIK